MKQNDGTALPFDWPRPSGTADPETWPVLNPVVTPNVEIRYTAEAVPVQAPWLYVQPDPQLTLLVGVLIGGFAMLVIGLAVYAAVAALAVLP